MVKKLKQLAEKQAASTAGLFDSALAGTVKESAQQIWLAGLGAFSKAQEEGGKVFEALVKEGATLQRKTQAVAEEKIGEMTSRMSTMAGDVTARAGQQWDKLETIFEERTSRALKKLGVPAATELASLVERIDALEAQVAKLSKPAGARRTGTRDNGAAKTTARRSTARKSTG
jgi:poly(hydroxyalkanoate) granule-associated protein